MHPERGRAVAVDDACGGALLNEQDRRPLPAGSLYHEQRGKGTRTMTSAQPQVSNVGPNGARAAGPDSLPTRVPGAHGPQFAVPLRWGTSRWAALDPEVMERVRAALRRL